MASHIRVSWDDGMTWVVLNESQEEDLVGDHCLLEIAKERLRILNLDSTLWGFEDDPIGHWLWLSFADAERIIEWARACSR